MSIAAHFSVICNFQTYHFISHCKHGYPQGQLAGKIGISTTYLGQIERGNNGKSYSLETLLSIAVGLDIDVNLLLSSSENI